MCLAAQIEEKRRADQQRDYADHLYQLKQVELDQKGLDLQNQETECLATKKIFFHVILKSVLRKFFPLKNVQKERGESSR